MPEGLTEERLTYLEGRAADLTGSPRHIARLWTIIGTLVAEVRRLTNEREEARGLAREYLFDLWEEEREEIRKEFRAKEAQVYPWLLTAEPATATGVAEAEFGERQWAPARAVIEVDGNKVTIADTWGGGKDWVPVEFPDEQTPSVE